MRFTILPILFALLLLPLTSMAVADQEPSAKATRATLRVGCFNAWLIPIVSKDRSARLARMPAALRALDLDVLCLQEVWSAGDQRELIRRLAKTFPHAVRGGGGLLVLSRFPVVSSTWVPFPHYKGLSLPEQLARKGLLEVVVRTDAGSVRIVTSHLALAFGEDNPRLKQLAFLLRRLDRQRALPLVLAADLNTWPVEDGRLTADYRKILARDLVDAKPPLRLPDGRYDPGQPTRIGWPRPSKPTGRGYYPDHVFFRSTSEQKLALQGFEFELDDRVTALSDHNLLRAELELVRKPAPKRRKR